MTSTLAQIAMVLAVAAPIQTTTQPKSPRKTPNATMMNLKHRNR